MRIFVTGASGFVGGAYLKDAAARHDIRAMSRAQASDEKIRALGATPVRCALGEVTAEHLAGADAIVHCAAFVEKWGRWSDFWRVNVDGTKQLLEVAKGAGAKRFVHIGTEAALFHGQPMRNVDEGYPLALNSPYPYSRTKAHAEKAVREANTAEFTTIVLRPRMVWGPGDLTILPAVKEMAAKGRFAWVGGGRIKTSTTYIGNLVAAIELALTRGGEAYFVLDDGPVEFRDFLTRLATADGFSLPNKEIPAALVRAVGFAGETLWRALGVKTPPPLTRFEAGIMSVDCILNDAKARAELGYLPPFSLDAGLAAVAASRRLT